MNRKLKIIFNYIKRNQFKQYIFIAVILLLMSSQVNAGTLPAFANGGFEGYTGNTNIHNSDVPPGWTTTGGTPDTFDGDTDFGSYTWESSSTGGDFLHGIGWQPSWTESALQVGLGGLTIGQEYEISFEQSISRSIWSQTGGYWAITFGAETQNSDLMAIPDYDELGGWDWYTMIFTASSEIQTLEVAAMSDTSGLRTDLGIDSFYLGTVGGNPDNPDTPVAPVPEPSTYLLLSSGMMGLAWFRRRQKKNS